MKEVQEVRYPIAALAGRTGCPPDPSWMRFVLARYRVEGVRVEGDELVAPSFVPVEPLIAGFLDQLRHDGVEPAPCSVCSELVDPEHDDGIFEDPQNLNGFICRPCAERMTAWAYYNERLRI